MHMNSETLMNNLVRIGAVSVVDTENRKARVVFHDKQDPAGNPLTSGWLQVLQTPPLIVIKKWKEDKSEPGEEPDEIEVIRIEEEANPRFEGIYHSARGMSASSRSAS